MREGRGRRHWGGPRRSRPRRPAQRRCKGVHLAAAPPGCVRFEWGQWVWACGRVGVWACGRVGGVWGSSWSGPGAKGVPAARRRRGSSCSCMRSLGSPRARPRGKGTCLTTRGACTARRAPRQGAWGVCSRSSESSSVLLWSCPLPERPSTPLFTHLRERYHEASASLVTTCIGLLQRMGGGKKQKCVENVEINVTVIFYEDTRGITQTAARRPRARSRCVRCPHRRQ